MTRAFASEGELFREALGDNWGDLHPDIQKRFDKNPTPGNPLRYTGVLDELYCSRWGMVLGHLTKPFIKGALIPYSQNGVPVDIRVYSIEDDPNIYKERNYKLVNRKSVLFTSHMTRSLKGEVLEYVGMGLGMKLIVSAVGGDLHFQSDGYFWDVGLFRVPIPDLFTPGKTFLKHVNRAPDSFSIRIEILHSIFGRTFLQTGTFSEIGDAG